MSKLNNKALSIFLLLSLFICLFSVLSIKNSGASEEWYDTRYKYRKQINFYGSYQTLTNYTAKIYVIKGNGVDTDQSIYLNSDADSNLTDLIFTTIDNVKTNRYVDIQDYNTGDWGSETNYTVYVRIPSLPVNVSTSLYAYWGITDYIWSNDNVTEEARNTFIAWDNFDDYNIGDNPAQETNRYWIRNLDYEINATHQIDIQLNPYTNNYATQNKVLRILHTASSDYLNKPSADLYFNYPSVHYNDLEINLICSYSSASADRDTLINVYEDGSMKIHNVLDCYSDKAWIIQVAGGSWQTKFALDNAKWYWVKLVLHDDNALDYDVYRNSTDYDSAWYDDTDEGVTRLRFGHQDTETQTLYVDNVFVRLSYPDAWIDPLIVSTGNLNESEYIILINQQYRTMMLSLFFGGFIMFFGGLTVLFKFKPKLDLSFACIFIIVLGLCFIIAGGN